MPRIDIHCHILPSIDDGPRESGESIAMAHVAHEDGTSVMVATPHQRDVMLNATVEKARDLVGALNEALLRAASTGPRPLRILLGMENHIEPDLPDWLDQGKALTLNRTRFILAEPPFTGNPKYVADVLGRLLLKRLVPVIAHPERNVVFQRRPKLLAEMIEAGMVMQVTAGSFTGAHGEAAQRAALAFLSHGLVHVIASDMHNSSGPRSPHMSAAVARVAELAGDENARMLFEDNPQSILEDRRPQAMRLLSPGPARWWFFGRVARIRN
ncbi:MAG: phosphotransferase [Dehalococcoidia bacterium]|nr:phosphotransferase [Dehalococcoidia bacterium]MSQ34751.1 phosphotransferase [Dehalococcoidia bacterium]